MPIVFAGSTVRIFTILSIGTVGITTRFTTIPSIIHHGILHTITGVGDIVGIHPGIAGDGDTLLITAIGTAHIIHTMAGVILTVPGMETEEDGMQIRIITGTDKEGQPERMCFVAVTMEEGLQLQACVHPTVQLKVPAKVQSQGLQTMAADQLQVQV